MRTTSPEWGCRWCCKAFACHAAPLTLCGTHLLGVNGPPAFILPFLPSSHFFFVEKFAASLPLGREPLCPPIGGLVSKPMCSANCERCRMTCKSFSIPTASPLRRCIPHNKVSQFRDVVLTIMVPPPSYCHFCQVIISFLWNNSLPPFHWAVNHCVLLEVS